MMGYTIGVSSGLWRIERPVELLGIPAKAQYIAREGVNFCQIDIETMAEFREPDLDAKMRKVRGLGIEVGVHGECAAMGSFTMPLESAIEAEYARSHIRLVEHIIGCAEKLKAKYVIIHASESSPFILLGRELQPSRLVDFWGRPLRDFLEKDPELLDWVVEIRDKHGAKIDTFIADRYEKGERFTGNDFLWEFIGITDIARVIASEERGLVDRFMHEKGRSPTTAEKEEIHKNAVERIKRYFLEHISTPHHAYGPERAAYYLIARWMRDSGDPLWREIVGERIADADLPKPAKIKKWVPAVAAKYIWGHFRQDLCPSPRHMTDYKEENPKVLLEKYKLYVAIETGMAHTAGYEAYTRLAHLPHIYALTKAIQSPYVVLTVDMEHMLGCNIDPVEDIKKLPRDAGRAVKVVHITVPSPLNPSHMPVPLASEAQYYIYKRLFELRQKGFEDGWLIFERGGEKGTVKQTIIVMRLIKDHLERNVPPEELTEEFFGLPKGGPPIKMQEVAIREHALDPLRGMLAVPEEHFTFLGKAVAPERREMWPKERYR
jgi:sugar phosphate isomerase/epimerase